MDDHLRAVLLCGEWCGLCYENVRGRRASRGHLRFRASRHRKELAITSYLSRVPGDGSGGNGQFFASPGAWGDLYPALSEFLVATHWLDGEPRIPGTLTIFTDGAGWKACLSDRAQSRVAFLSGADPVSLLSALEGGLVGGLLDWRSQRNYGGKKRKESS